VFVNALEGSQVTDWIAAQRTTISGVLPRFLAAHNNLDFVSRLKWQILKRELSAGRDSLHHTISLHVNVTQYL